MAVKKMTKGDHEKSELEQGEEGFGDGKGHQGYLGMRLGD
jgi:hypothetical protein